MNGVSLSNQVIHWNPKKFAVKQNFNKVIKENEKVFNDYYWKSNKAEGVDYFGRTIDQTSLINKPDGYLQGSNGGEKQQSCWKEVYPGKGRYAYLLEQAVT